MLYVASCLEERIHKNHSGITPIFATLFIPKTLLKVMPVSDCPGQEGFFLFCVIVSTSTALSLDLSSRILRKNGICLRCLEHYQLRRWSLSMISLDAYCPSCSDWMLVESAVVLWSGLSSQAQAQQMYGPFLHCSFFLSQLGREQKPAFKSGSVLHFQCSGLETKSV